MSARPIRPSDGWRASAILSQAHSSGSASVTRQKALANGPTSARRTKIGDMPIASAPTTRAANGAPKPPCGLAAGEACVIRLRFPRPERAMALASRRAVLILAAGDRQGGGMDARAWREADEADDDFAPFEQIPGALDGGVLVVCDHAANALPPRYGDLGLPREALERHIAYDIGAAWLARRLAARLGAPAVLSTFSRLLIDANRGADDPTLVMRVSDGDLVPGNARIDAAEIERRRQPLLGALPRRRSRRRSRRCWRAASRRRSCRSTRSRRIGGDRRGRGRSACCGIPIRACPRR